MHLNLNGNLWQEVTTRVVLQLLQTLSCLHFLDPFHSGKENELLLGLGESISILHFIMQAIFLTQELSASCLTLQHLTWPR